VDLTELMPRNSICFPLLAVSDCERIGAYIGKAAVDEMYLVYLVEDDKRVEAMPDMYEMIGKRKLGRKIRTRLTAKIPGAGWRKLEESTFAN